MPTCAICKDPDSWVEYAIPATDGGDDAVGICSVCHDRLQSGILLVCNHCESMAFVPRTARNIARLQTFLDVAADHFNSAAAIVLLSGCPHCVSFQHSQLGERVSCR